MQTGINEYHDQRIKNLENQIEQLTCKHLRFEIRYRKATNGTLMYKKQCIRCGETLGDWIPHSRIPPAAEIVPIDDGLPQRYQLNVRELKQALFERKKELERKDFFESYDEYLNTPEWREKRVLVFKRCNGICEGCGIKKATEIHHLSYKNVGNEFLFELAGVCSDCHIKAHPPEAVDENA